MIIFRVDSSTKVGSGHMMRCLTLAEQVRKKTQEEIAFISRDLDGNLNQLVCEQGYRLLQLPKVMRQEELLDYEKWLTVKIETDAEQTAKIIKGMDITCMIVDSYALDQSWEKKIRPYVSKIMVIDDLSNRYHDCDLLLDQTLNAEKQNKYINLVPPHCKLYLGLKYVLLRREFYEYLDKLRIRDGSIRKILVFYGGSDDTNETMKFLAAWKLWKNVGIEIDVIVGNNNVNKEEIEADCCEIQGVKFHCQVENMAEFIQNADFAFGAAGSNTWERCVLGLPAAITITAENQIAIAEEIASCGAAWLLGWHQNMDIEAYLKALGGLHNTDLKNMSQKALHVIGENSVCQVVKSIIGRRRDDAN